LNAVISWEGLAVIVPIHENINRHLVRKRFAVDDFLALCEP
jgi:hypothetical protein